MTKVFVFCFFNLRKFHFLKSVFYGPRWAIKIQVSQALTKNHVLTWTRNMLYRYQTLCYYVTLLENNDDEGLHCSYERYCSYSKINSLNISSIRKQIPTLELQSAKTSFWAILAIVRFIWYLMFEICMKWYINSIYNVHVDGNRGERVDDKDGEKITFI